MIRLESVTKTYGTVMAVDRVSLEVAPGVPLALLGPSGSGKSTLLRLIAGLERPDAGSVSIDGRTSSTPSFVEAPYRRHLGMVFQHPALWSHMTVAETVRFGLTHPRSSDARARVTELLQALELDGLGDRRPHELSGGQAQRVALARALAPRPRVILLDEPFGSLDDDLARRVVRLLEQIVADEEVTLLYVSHDLDRARILCPQAALIERGRITASGRWNDLGDSR